MTASSTVVADKGVRVFYVRLLKRGLVRRVTSNSKNIEVLKDFAALELVLVDGDNIVVMSDRLFDKISADAAELHDDDVQAFRLPSSPLK